MTKYYPIKYFNNYCEVQDVGTVCMYEEAVEKAKETSKHTKDEVVLQINDEYVEFYEKGIFTGRGKIEDLKDSLIYAV